MTIKIWVIWVILHIVTESYGSKIFTMEKHTKDRDLIIRFCIAGHFNWDETNRALKLYGLNELYAKDPRDAVLIVAINNRIYNLYDIDEMLLNMGWSAWQQNKIVYGKWFFPTILVGIFIFKSCYHIHIKLITQRKTRVDS